MHDFLIKVKKERKYWIELLRVLRWMMKVFSVLVSIESLASTLSHLLAIFLFFKWSVNYAYFGYVCNISQ